LNDGFACLWVLGLRVLEDVLRRFPGAELGKPREQCVFDVEVNENHVTVGA
jgi:hypothetical protein